MRNSYFQMNKSQQPHVLLSEFKPNFNSAPDSSLLCINSMEGVRTMKPLSNANYWNQSSDVALNLDEQFCHNVSLGVRPDFQNVAPEEKNSPNSASFSFESEPLDSTSPGQQAYVDDWFTETYMQIQMLRERYTSEVDIIYKMVKDPCPEPLSGASLTRYQKKIGVAKMIIRVLSIRKADLARYSKDKVTQRLNLIKWHLDAIRIKRHGAVSHHEQHHPPADHSTSQLQRNRNMEVMSSQLDIQGLTNQHTCSPQSSKQQGFSLSEENSISSLCTGSLVGNALCSFQSSPKRLKQQSPTNHAIQTNMVASPNVEFQFGSEQKSQSLLHGLGQSLYIENLNSQKNPLPSAIVNSLVPTMSRLLTSSDNSSHAVKQKAKNQIMHTENMRQPVLKSRIEKKMQQMVVQKEFSLQQHNLSIQSAGYSPQSLTSSLPATDHEKQSFCAENTVHLQRPLIPVEESQTEIRNYIPAGSSSEKSACPLSIKFDTPEISLQPQPINRLINVVNSMSSEVLCASLQDFNAVINLVDNIATPTTSTESGYRILETNPVSSGTSSHDKVNRQISATAFNSLSSFSRGTSSKRVCNQAADMISTATYGIKKQRIEQNRDILGEIRAINLQLIETSLDVDFHLPGVGDGTIIKCSYNAVGTLAKCLRMQYPSSQMLPDFIMRWLVPADYPHSSPMLLDTLPGWWSEVFGDMSEKLVLKLNQSIRTLSHPISLEYMIRNWDASARAVFTEFAEGIVGRSLRSNLGKWERCITTS
ncbi:hypothetical protein POM88_041518 [Heracleum sosnowskyi]|uniref:Uncharacterized protein n=1 Tax=Heracleum sosnowskyi TaxID=360622 RepID=A0AAD8MAT1_9APIA|nr:hypothetical protein POM88_041518 [Heracleum sosnowskyi]